VILYLQVFSIQFAVADQNILSPGGVVYYVDSIDGNDVNTGTTPKTAWKSLERVNLMVFAPGDKLLFKAGTVYTGRLNPHGSGKKDSPIVVDVFDKGDKPRIDAEGKFMEAVMLYNVEYWELNNIEITNTGKNRQPGRKGVHIKLVNFGTAHHFVLKNLFIHDINGSNVKNEGGGFGIFLNNKEWESEPGLIKSRFDGVLIESCHLVRTDRNGICGSGYWKRNEWYPSLNVVIRGNLLVDIGGDCIVPIGCDGCLIEYNVVNGGRQRATDAAAGIWPWSCDNTVVQFNEVYNMKGTLDGHGFDSDWNCKNSLFQYNYSHDNEGGFQLVCNNTAEVMPTSVGNIGTVVRYNISQNDGEYSSGPIFELTGTIQDTTIYNNVVYIGSHLDVLLINTWDWGGGLPDNTRFYNNIFYVAGQARFNILAGTTNSVFENNVWYGNFVSKPYDSNAITSDPKLVNVGSGSIGRDTLGGYKLLQDSSCIGAGTNTGIAYDDADYANGGRDFWGNALPGINVPDIGAYQKID